jgi:predicted dehydrogenase
MLYASEVHQKKVNVILIGYGYWGKRLALAIKKNSDYILSAVFETNPIHAASARADGFPKVLEFYENFELTDIDLCIIATRPKTHLVIAKYFMLNKIPCLITKPVTSSMSEAIELEEISRISGTKLFFDYTYLYSSYLEKMKLWFDNVVQPESYMSHRSSLGIIQSDVSVIEDLGSHDIANLIYLVGKLPSSVQSLFPLHNKYFSNSDNFFTLNWEEEFTANIFISWRSPKKIRHINIMAKQESIILDELNENPLSVIPYEPDFLRQGDISDSIFEKRNISYSMGESINIDIDKATPLEIEFKRLANHFLNRSDISYKCSDSFFLKVWKVLDALNKSSANFGSVTNVEK